MGSIIVNLPVGPVVLGHRSLVEYRFRDTGSGWRYRAQIRFEVPLRLIAKSVVSYVTGEGVYDIDESGWTGFQTQVGLRSEIGATFSVTPF